ncbi:bifunctional diaminohydroxyphosphoribosylaminopyrimidine deaminase/5-amino-6-(5-phosphoribosylamino)uracil reductase RibD [Hydrogenovibrio marinus]|uniref:Riboflavin biosynthesis protein RibD n=1 Tax=Hydrogenovibrio marinus TaxID=28885 RepID=A0A066ZSW7_HYDMR|nr:bifunctional diaminohydroxyphosphoribosylaminopyrimidine deaminase/5-amino-6-(5-phosphoribosylamino)uracil reductase RibD [Hydrogenovibrio marinus]KDN95374.1 riboflavin biosynthesis protein RibD [Hydrogenovibrio marinus]BBN59861.1 riboflavin biosynthesis protein RibD [Hydrogenovibrio marinus]
MFSDFDQEMMRQAIDLAKQGYYSTKPNPSVGCVITKDGRIISTGWHQKAGEPHAERVALANAKAASLSVEGATVYVTLEPCSHFGKTPPCADALVDAKVARVVVAMQDPNPQVGGSGIKRLQAAGINVDVGLMQADAESLNKGFIFSMTNNRPFVRLKIASSLDGRTAMSDGKSQWITGAEARVEVHKMRAMHGAVVTGIGTVLADNPSLNVRLDSDVLASMNLDETTANPIRVVLDANLSMPLDAKMLSLPGRTLLMTSKITAERNPDLIEKIYQVGGEVVAVAAEDDRLDIESVLQYLYEVEQVRDVMVEAGAIVAGAFIESGFVNEIHAFVAPSLMGDSAKPMFALPSIQSMSDKIQYQFDAIQKVGEDLHLVLSPSKSTLSK